MMNEKNINSYDEESQIAMISSFQEHQIFMKKIINNVKTELIEMKKYMKTIEKELDVLVSQ